eukprot:TRINITY_DN11969_c0_g1_i1.p1 TRINITY_DN11969_c0_g1~~TRINITY_DN11969_c0_g1_i1.p1  ORF type:complete len:1006 (-),score=228.60 TRINITY_DN11969_c0_g1_i1:206-3055(-)
MNISLQTMNMMVIKYESFINFEGCEFYNVGAKRLIYAIQSKLYVEDCIFHNNYGNVFHLIRSLSSIVMNSVFAQNQIISTNNHSFYDKGGSFGTICLIQSYGIIKFSKNNFTNNYSDFGGVFAILDNNVIKIESENVEYQTIDVLSLNFVDNKYVKNNALIGGVIFTNLMSVDLKDLFIPSAPVIHDNFASYYGVFFATDPRSLKQFESRTTIIDSIPNTFVSIKLFDDFDQHATFNWNREVFLTSVDADLALQGNMSIISTNGFANFSNVQLHGDPGNYDIFASSAGLNPAKFQVTIDFCVEGLGFDAETNQCYECPVGTYSSDSSEDPCINCEIGTWTSSKRSSECYPCPIGTYRNDPDDLINGCIDCPSSSYTNDVGSVKCIKCPNGMQSSSSRDGCECAGSMYPVKTWNETAKEYYVSCIECPEGLMCFGNNDFCVKEGYWYNSDVQEVFECQQDGCQGNCEAKLSGKNITLESDSCIIGSTGPLCGECDNGYFSLGNECVQCFSSSINVLLLIIPQLIWIAIFYITFVSRKSNYALVAFLKTFLRYLHIISALTLVLLVKFPTFITKTLVILRILFVDIINFSTLHCLNFDAEFIFYFIYAYALAYLIIIFLICFILRSLCEWKQMFFSFFLLNVMRYSFLFSRLFDCTSNGVDSRITEYSGIICDNSNVLFNVLRIISILFFIFIVFMYIFLTKKDFSNENELEKKGKSKSKGKSSKKKKIKEKFFKSTFFTFAGLTIDLKYFHELFEFFGSSVLGIWLMFLARSTVFQACLGFSFSFIFLTQHLSSYSYKLHDINQLQTFYLSSILMMFLLQTLIKLDVVANDSIVVVFVFVLLLLCSIIMIIRNFLKIYQKIIDLSDVINSNNQSHNPLRNPMLYLANNRTSSILSETSKSSTESFSSIQNLTNPHMTLDSTVNYGLDSVFSSAPYPNVHTNSMNDGLYRF